MGCAPPAPYWMPNGFEDDQGMLSGDGPNVLGLLRGLPGALKCGSGGCGTVKAAIPRSGTELLA